MYASLMRTGPRALPAGAELLFAALPLFLAPSASAGGARGTISYGARKSAIAHAYLVKGPDAVDDRKVIRRLVLTTTDIGPKIAACATMSCVDANVTEGMEVDFDAGPRLNYWVALDGQKTQYSGTAVPDSLAASANDARRLAGRLSIDDSSAGGPAVDVEFDAPLVRAFDRAR